MSEDHYVLASGVSGRERLRILGRVMEDGTRILLDKAGVGEGMACLDAGCGGGDVSVLLANLVGPAGSVLGIDRDAATIDIAQGEAQEKGLDRVTYRCLDILDFDAPQSVDVLYCRFLLTHLPERDEAVRQLLAALRPGGLAIFEDIDFSGHFSAPNSDAMQEYMRLYSAATRHLGGDATFGLRMPAFLKNAGVSDLAVRINQPAALEGETKLINALTMQAAADHVVEAGLATDEEITRIVRTLYDEAREPDTLISAARVVQAWGRKPGARPRDG